MVTVSVVSFAFFLWLFLAGSVQDILRGKRACVAVVNGTCISLRDYRMELLPYSQFLKNKGMESIIKEQVLDSLIVRELLYQKALEMGFVASDEEVIDTIRSDPTFQEGGVFSASKYREVLERNNLEPAQYEEYLRKMLSIQKLVSFISNSVYITEKEKQANLLPYTTLLTGKLYLITPDSVKISYEPTDAELLNYYQQHREEFKKPEKRVVRLWETPQRDEALNIYNQLKSSKVPTGYREVILPQQEAELSPVLRAEITRLSSKEPYTVTKDGDKFVVLWLYSWEPSGYEDFNNVKDKIKQLLVQQKRLEKLQDVAQSAYKDLKEGKQIDYRYLAFSDTPISQLASLMKIQQEDLVKLLVSKETVFGPYAIAQGYAVLKIESKTTKSLDDKQQKDLIKDILSLKTDSVLNYYLESLKKKAKITINRDLITGQ